MSRPNVFVDKHHISRISKNVTYVFFHENLSKLKYNVQTRNKRTQFGKVTRTNSAFGLLIIFLVLLNELSPYYPVTQYSY